LFLAIGQSQALLHTRELQKSGTKSPQKMASTYLSISYTLPSIGHDFAPPYSRNQYAKRPRFAPKIGATETVRVQQAAETGCSFRSHR
jgi:hypothetical protein